ncbi:hypothetical protein FCOIX_7194 [Fusarium coicis]|nr:hypothetical protein FCOIX_7194 [Fusarium coicis]
MWAVFVTGKLAADRTSNLAHIWYGRVLMILGIVNGGLGLQLAGASKKLIIGYGMVGLVTSLMNTAGAVRKMLRGAKKHQHGPLKYNGSYSAAALIRPAVVDSLFVCHYR